MRRSTDTACPQTNMWVITSLISYAAEAVRSEAHGEARLIVRFQNNSEPRARDDLIVSKASSLLR